MNDFFKMFSYVVCWLLTWSYQNKHNLMFSFYLSLLLLFYYFMKCTYSVLGENVSYIYLFLAFIISQSINTIQYV
jgi:hypothetical protein